MSREPDTLESLEAELTLPAWLEAELPPLRVPAEVLVEAGARGKLFSPEDEPLLEGSLQEVLQEAEVRFPENYRVLGASCLSPEEGEHYFGKFDWMLLQEGSTITSDEVARYSILRSWKIYLSYRKLWEREPENWAAAYQLLDHHPLFWRRRDAEEPWAWDTSGAGTHSYILVSPKPSVAVEFGPHTEDYSSLSHDPYLDLWAPSFELLYPAMVRMLDAFYTPEGEDRYPCQCEPYPQEGSEEEKQAWLQAREEEHQRRRAVQRETLASLEATWRARAEEENGPTDLRRYFGLE